jgi:ABC-type phosphate/phosphonate transport system substrate-binding protein
MRRTLHLIFCWVLTSLLPTAVTAQPGAEVTSPPVDIRVGITEYQNIEETYAKYQDFFQELIEKWEKGRSAATQSTSFRFRVAVGTYEEVREWYNTNRIDVAVFSAMPLTEMLASLPVSPDAVRQGYAVGQEATLTEKIKAAYLGTLTPLRGRSPFDNCANGSASRVLFDQIYSEQEKQALKGAREDYRTVCLVPNDSEVDSADALEKNKGRLRFLFVRPYSVSGYLLPAFNLLKFNPHIDITTEDYEFTYQHSKTLEKLRNAKKGKDSDGKYLVGCVLDTTRECPANGGGGRDFKKIAGLDWDAHTPAETVLLNYHLEQGRLHKITSIMTEVFDRWQEDEKSLFRLVKKNQPDEIWKGAYSNVREPVLKVTKPASFSHRSTLDEIIEDLLHYQKLNSLNSAATTTARGAPIKPLRLVAERSARTN